MSIVTGANGHTFGTRRPSHGGQARIHTEPPRDTHFRDLPPPVGAPPYHLDLKDVLAPSAYQAILDSKSLVFHLNGDMGGIKEAMPQQLVANGMEQDLDKLNPAGQAPDFLYITGDCVYFNGEIAQYYAQFYAPYENYHRPIFAVPGNHDGENLTTGADIGNTLDGFGRNFCAPRSGTKTPEAGDSFRTAMNQPNFYWTLLTPLCSIVGLYSNVPEGGDIRAPQTDWLISELRSLPTDIPLFIALHHPPYSADNHHSGSSHMRAAIAAAVAASGREPDMVLAGHVHDYQRLSAHRATGTLVPHLVCGAGGYHNLHAIQKVDGERMITPSNFDAGDGEVVRLEKYSDDHHGFLRMEIGADTIIGRYYEVPRPQEPYSKGSQLLDYWEYEWKQRQWIENRP
jgi:3',5'-cyclic AMP phosphodiesterase CpdA